MNDEERIDRKSALAGEVEQIGETVAEYVRGVGVRTERGAVVRRVTWRNEKGVELWTARCA